MIYLDYHFTDESCMEPVRMKFDDLRQLGSILTLLKSAYEYDIDMYEVASRNDSDT